MSWAQGQGANLYFQHRALTACSAVDVALDKDDAGSLLFKKNSHGQVC